MVPHSAERRSGTRIGNEAEHCRDRSWYAIRRVHGCRGSGGLYGPRRATWLLSLLPLGYSFAYGMGCSHS
jgi:hypothetical protein